MTAQRFDVTEAGRVALASESTAPSHGENHPGALACHAINNAAQIIAAIATRARWSDSPYWQGDLRHICNDAARATELLVDAGGHIGSVVELLERQERVIEEQRLEYLREKKYSARVEDKNSELVQSVLNLTRQLHDATTHSTPRLTAAGGQ